MALTSLDVPLTLQRLEDRRVLSVAPWAAPAIPALASSPVDSLVSQESVAPASTDAPSASSPETAINEATRQINAEESSTVPSEERADHLAALLGQAVNLPPGSPGVAPALQLLAEDVPNSIGSEPDLSNVESPLATLEDGESSLPIVPEFAPPAAPSLPEQPNLDLPLVEAPELEQTASPSTSDEVLAGANMGASDGQLSTEDDVTNGGESTTADAALPAVEEVPEDALEPVFLEAGAAAPTDEVLASLAAGNLAALRRALEAMLFELGKFDPNAADASTRLALLLWLSAAAAATTAGCLIVRRHLKADSQPDERPRSDDRARQPVYEPLLA